MSRDILEFVANFVLPRVGISPQRLHDFASTDLIEARLVDSLGIIELIGHIELEYNMQFSAEQMQDPRFRTMHGLAQLISESKEL